MGLTERSQIFLPDSAVMGFQQKSSQYKRGESTKSIRGEMLLSSIQIEVDTVAGGHFIFILATFLWFFSCVNKTPVENQPKIFRA